MNAAPPPDGGRTPEPGDKPGDEPGDGGSFGWWTTDVDGFPEFSFATPSGASLVAPAAGAAVCWHGIGNAGITALAHAGGWTTLYATARGMTRLTGPASSWGLAQRTPDQTEARFGLGSATWRRTYGTREVTRRVAAPVDGQPVLRIDVTVRGGQRGDAYVEEWVPEPRALLVGALMSSFESPPPGYGWREQVAWRGLYSLSSVVRAATNAARLAIGPTLLRAPQPDPHRNAIVFPARRRVAEVAATKPAWFDPALPDLFVAYLGPGGAAVEASALRVVLDPHLAVDGAEPVCLSFAIGLARDDADRDRLVGLAADPAQFAAARWARLAELAAPDAPALARETRWHAAALVAAEQHDDHFGRRYIAQGSAYGFVHGLQGAPRDYALYAVPMAFLDPVAAREQIDVMLRMTRPSGATYYAHTGRGQCTSGGLHAAPTDLPLFLLWAVTEYVWTTGDTAFLDTPVPFHPAPAGVLATPRERVLLALRYLDERVGLGPHGLLRVGSGDWSDPISAMVADRSAFHEHGESGFNTAFAAYVLPRVARLLDADHPDAAARARELGAGLADALADTWTGSWFLRGWDGRGAPIGADHLFLDGQVWALIAGVGSPDQREALVRSIAERCDDPSPIGATILDRPHDVRLGMLAPGWDCNGGVWATINALLAWGYALHDPALARRNLEKQSLAAHARAYPHIWYGIWSGPDAYNAHFGSRPGETFVQPATPMREFPVLNANAHAGPLLATLRVLGIETEPGGIVVRDRGAAFGDWSLRTALGSFSPDGFVPARTDGPGA